MSAIAYQFPTPIILEVTGKDSPRYLHARLTNEVKNLKVGSAVLAAALNPQGRTEGLFWVQRVGDQQYYLTCDGGEAEKIISALKRYIVADRVTVTERSQDLMLVHLVGAETPPISTELNLLAQSLVKRLGVSGKDLILPKQSAAALGGEFQRLGAQWLTDSAWQFLRISAGLPTFPAELNPDTIFSEAGLGMAVSFTKGCYVGQEVVEKIDARGRTPRVLRRLRVAGKLSAADVEVLTLGDAPQKIGEIVSSANDPASEVSFAFASLKNDSQLLQLNLQVAGLPATVLDSDFSQNPSQT